MTPGRACSPWPAVRWWRRWTWPRRTAGALIRPSRWRTGSWRLSTPLIVDGKPVGVLNLYASTPRAFSAVDRQLAGLLAGQAAIAITAALRHYDEVTLADHLRLALSSRSVIDQAIGIVMAQRRCSPEEAFATLRTISQRRNIKLRHIAAELVDATQRPSQDNPPPA
jgi:hypothetical protein